MIQISLDTQVHVYSLDTSAFYNENESKIHKKQNKVYRYRTFLKDIKNKTKDENEIKKLNKHLSYANLKADKLKSLLYAEFTKNRDIRKLNERYLTKKNIISIFESTLTRTLKIEKNTLSEDIMVVQTYYFDVLEDIILHGFDYKNEHYVCFTASAGQIRTKKTVFIKESVLNKYQNILMCGLTIDKINSLGGVNINKYLAYLALCNSATDVWNDFDINKSIVVEDMETMVTSVVDFIDDKTYEITRKEMEVPINHMDGCGIMLPSVSKKSMMIRLPWVKGLFVPFPFDTFIKEQNKINPNVNYGVIKDIYGKEHDVLKDNISYIFTKSQFKMWKYYSSWEEYKINFLKYKCIAAKCNEEEDIFENAKLNYQMLQTLTDVTHEELKVLCEDTNYQIENIGKDKKTMLRVLGVTKGNRNKNYLQQALEIYPELLNDTYSKEILKQVKKSLVKEAKAGKLNIEGKYTFLCPDLYAFCEYLFLNDKNPKGLLKNGEVSCKLYSGDKKINCLRSPHLYREHGVRRNIVNNHLNKWYVTMGLYTSVHDCISKVLMFDNDGDKSLVVGDELFVKIAERNMNDIVPLFYNMAKADAEIINNKSIYNGLKRAYTGGNIGMISNDITKLWNKEHINLDIIRWLTFENNFVIDYAKTLYKPTRPKEINKMISSSIKVKVPYFFIYAKDKPKKSVELINNSTVNNLDSIIVNPRISFSKAGIKDFNYKMLMSTLDKEVDLNKGIIDKYTELDLNKRFLEILPNEKNPELDGLYIYADIRNQILEVNSDINYVVDVLVEYLYKYKVSNYKTTLWSSFGDIILSNLKNNIELVYGNETILCEECTKRIKLTSHNKKYCDDCFREKQLEWQRNSMKKKRNNVNV